MDTDDRPDTESVDGERPTPAIAAGAAPPPGGRPLIVTSDVRLLDELLPLAAAGCGDVDVAGDAVAARRCWRSASLVVIGADAAAGCVRARLPDRRDVVLVGRLVDGQADESSWQAAGSLGADHVVVLPAATAWLTTRFGSAGTSRRDSAPMIGVLGGRGGAGASVLAGGLAVTAARTGERAMLVDADPLGGGLDLVLGWEAVPGCAGPSSPRRDGRVDAPRWSGPCRSRGDLVVLSGTAAHCDVPAEAMAATVDAGRRGRDLVVVDLPRQLDDGRGQRGPGGRPALIVVPAELRATAAAARVVAAAAPHCRRPAVIVVAGPRRGGWAVEVARRSGCRCRHAAARSRVCRGLERGEAPAATGRGRWPSSAGELLAELTGVPGRGMRHDAGRPRRPGRPGSAPVRRRGHAGHTGGHRLRRTRRADAAVLGDTALLRMADRVHDDLIGAGPLAPLLADPQVTDVLVNGTRVWVGPGRRAATRWPSAGAADDGTQAGPAPRCQSGAPARRRAPRTSTRGCPTAPGCTPCCRRWQPTGRTCRCAPSGNGRSPCTSWSRQGTVHGPAAALLAGVVAARLAYLVTGGTGSGKTTLLNTLLGLVPATERIVWWRTRPSCGRCTRTWSASGA